MSQLMARQSAGWRRLFCGMLLMSGAHNSATIAQNLDDTSDLPFASGFASSNTKASDVFFGVTDTRVIFGQSASLRGNAGQFGNAARSGILSAFKAINDKGGVHGRMLELITLDDGYEPNRAIANTRQFIEEIGVFALAGGVGTSTVRASAPIAAAADVPYIAPFTGAADIRLRWRNMIHLRASYDQETETMVRHLIEDLAIKRVAVLYQNDYFGRDGYEGARLALERRGLEPVSSGVYERNTSAIKGALLDIRQGNPEAVIIIGAYQAAAELILWSRFAGFDPVFIAISFVGGNALASALGKHGADVFVTQVVPSPTISELPVARDYLRALAAIDPEAEPGFVSFEGYLLGRLIIDVLDRCGQMLTRGRFFDVFEGSGPIDLGGFQLVYEKGLDQGSDAVFLTAIDDLGRYQPIKKLTDIVQCVNC